MNQRFFFAHLACPDTRLAGLNADICCSRPELTVLELSVVALPQVTTDATLSRVW